MNIVQADAKCFGFKLLLTDEYGQEVGRAFLYIMFNEQHESPFGLMEDLFIAENIRSQGIGSSLIKKIIELAKEKGCYKLIATSRNTRPEIHELYCKLGFQDYGLEFRMDL